MTRPSWIGQTLGGRYRIDDILGQGGMSAVYKAFDPNLKRVVAVKMIHAHLAEDPKFIVRFEEEAAAVAQLRHPNIVQVFDFNHDQDLYYMVQEFVPGETLQEKLRRLNKTDRRMPLAEAIGYIINICDATSFAHQRGLIHRDIKPANIMINVHGQAILMDFGIVKITGGEKHTATGAVVGTALYLAPEAIRGETPDPRSDLYSLGVTLFEMVSGRPPFEADSAMTLMMMHLNDPLPDMRGLRPDIPPVLIAIIEKALAKDRDQRYASMTDFAVALRGVLANLGSSAPSATQADQLPSSQQQPAQTSGAWSSSGVPVHSSEAGRTVAPPLKPIETRLVQSDSYGVASGKSQSPHLSSDQIVTPVATASTKPRSKLLLLSAIGGIAVVGMVIVLIAAAFLLRKAGGLLASPVTPSVTIASELVMVASPTATQPAEVAVLLGEPSATLTPTSGPTLPPTATPTITPSPTPTIPVGVLYSRINSIAVNSQGYYVVDYETFEYTEVLPGQHVHFFFNSVPPEQAGVPGSGPWKLYGGPRPFDEYLASDRPAAATQMCILVAYADHSVRQESGNCFILPDVTAAVPVFDDPCLAGPGSAYPVMGQLSAGQVLLVTGISPDEAWWTVDSANTPGLSCWLQRSRSDFSGDISTLPMAEVPTLPGGSPSGVSVQITQITLNTQGEYVVEFTTSGFTPALPGTHMHFFFDIFAAEQVGSTGSNRLMYGSASPFTGYTQVTRPQGATQLCALVANPNHTVIPGSGNCVTLP